MGKQLVIRSWNMQGSGRKKILYLNPTVGNTILMCQESGPPHTKGFSKGNIYKSYKCLGSYVDQAAENQRCTTSVLATQDIAAQITTTPFEVTNRYSIITRPLVRAVINMNENIYIYTYHATASEYSSVAEIIEILKGIINKRNKDDKWIFIGDFNSEPKDYLHYVPSKCLFPKSFNHICIPNSTISRSTIWYTCALIYHEDPTQGITFINNNSLRRRRFLDFAFVSINMESHIKNMYNDFVINENMILSDHNCISLLLDFN